MTTIIDGTVGANKGVVLDSNGKLPAIDGSQLTTLNGTQVTTGTIATARIDAATTGANKVLMLDGSGVLGAVDGSQLTGVASATKSSSNPTISSNPSGGLGSKWINTSTGQIFICTDATAGENIWTNVGAGSADIEPYAFQGTNYGFLAGGYVNGAHNGIHRFSLTSDGNATDWADMATGRETNSGSHSDTHGYTLGGSSNVNNIEKFQFSSAANATDIADLSYARHKTAGHSTATHGYCSAGEGAPGNRNEIDKHSLTADTNATDVGDVTVARAYVSGSSSPDYGYTAGGTTGSVSNIIDKFSFSTDGNSTDVADLLAAINGTAGSSSSTHGVPPFLLIILLICIDNCFSNSFLGSCITVRK